MDPNTKRFSLGEKNVHSTLTVYKQIYDKKKKKKKKAKKLNKPAWTYF